jgi:hypothetical protein
VLFSFIVVFSPMKLLRLLGLFVVLTFAIEGCSSSTSPSPTPSAKLIVPASIDFGVASVARWHDETFSIQNIGDDSAVITGFHFGAVRVTGTIVKDTVDVAVLPMTIAVGKSATFHVQVFAPDSGAQSITDSILFTASGKSQVATSLVRLNGTYATPAAGSTFRYHIVAVDTNGVTIIDGDSTVSVLANDLVVGGKTNVVAILNPGGDTAYYQVVSNGDVASDVAEYFNPGTVSPAGIPFKILPLWIIVPVGTRNQRNYTILDTTFNGLIQGLEAEIHFKVVVTSAFSGVEDITVGQEIFHTTRAAVISSGTFTFTLAANGQTYGGTEIHTSNLWYMPKLSFYAKQEDVVQPAGSSKTSAATSTLVSYNLR